jgi:hypothetical protein
MFLRRKCIKKSKNLQSRPAYRRHRLYMFVAWLCGRRAEEVLLVSRRKASESFFQKVSRKQCAQQAERQGSTIQVFAPGDARAA